ncbi:stage V sporulation protein K [Streptomyces phaeoluteigriseus]|uniref:Stage V sporulation protein K n=1 Tax=Streptomyces phaeoluteigriseus TaxID=114686 RepID=A0A1V6MM44_9ACTN|nr:right-handed parallel beta-helix repeat-containing protein [Streptomyces phaeoluteigriseus]OQD53560.1 stage V sporulation protein K [Streptomyces phaeoluteigriseus]
MVRRYVVAPHGGRRAHPDISSALRAAAERHGPALIEIAPGHYEESLTVRGEVELTGMGGPGSVLVSPPQGTVLDAFGTVRVRGLLLVGREADVVDCLGGTLALEHTEVRAHGGVCVHARRGTRVALTDCVFRYGRTLFAGAAGTIERCGFHDAADNALAVIEGARVSVRDSRFEGSRIHGVRVSDAWAELVGCALTGTEKAAVMADTRAELTMAGCRVDSVHAEAVMFIEQSRGLVRDVRVSDAEHGIGVASGADPVVRDCVFADCRDTGINVQTTGRGTFESCEVLNAGSVSLFSTNGGAPRVNGCRVAGGNVGVAVVDKARGHFTDVVVEDLAGAALRVFDESRAVFERTRVERCPAGLEVRGNGATTAQLTDVRIAGFDMAAVAVTGEARVTLTRVSAERGLLGFGVGEEAFLQIQDCEVSATRAGGAVAFGRARLVARNLTVTGSEAFGLCGTESAYVDVADSRFDDCAAAGVTFDESGGGRLVNCSVTGTRGVGVQHNGRVDLVSLHTSRPVVERVPEPAPAPVQVVNNHYHGPVFNAAVHGVHLAWNNDRITQQIIQQDASQSTAQVTPRATPQVVQQVIQEHDDQNGATP